MGERNYRRLNADRIVSTIEQLHARILARFPDAGLGRVCAELMQTAAALSQRAASLSRAQWIWRLAAIALFAGGVAAQVAAIRFLHVGSSLDAIELVQSLEAAVNLLILFGGTVWFLLTLEERGKRRAALDALHQLRSLAHVIDMHQLTKDPTPVLEAQQTPASPQRRMTRFELTRYLDYCSEMLALIGKVAALFADRMRDPVVIDAVNDIENLTNGLGRKIWQKITIITALESDGR